jgi:cytochrome P450
MDVDLYTPEVVADPWPTLARIREAGPMLWNERGYWMTARDRVCRRIFANPERFSCKPVVPAFFGEEAFISIDDKARHNELRLMWSDSFRPASIARLAGVVRGIAERMLDPLVERLAAGETVDMVEGICRHLPAYVIAHLLGVPREMQDMLIEWSDRMAASTAAGYEIDYENDPAWLAGEQAKRDMADFIVEQIRHRRAHPGDDLISQMVHSPVGRTLSEEAMVVNTRQLLFAGSETTANWLGHIVHILGRRPELQRELRVNPSLVRPAVEEILRWEPVVHALPRTVVGGDVEIEGVTIPEGAPVVPLLGAANRDPRRYDNPDELDIRRPGPSSLAFGFAIHNCIGIFLARLEAAETTGAILDRLSGYVLADEVRYTGFTLRGPAAVAVTLNRAAS